MAERDTGRALPEPGQKPLPWFRHQISIQKNFAFSTHQAMVQLVKICFLFSWLLIVFSNHAQSKKTDRDVVLKNLKTMKDIDSVKIDILAYDLERKKCFSYGCEVVKTLSKALYAVSGYYLPNSMAQGPPPDDYDQIMLRTVRKSILSHPEMFDDYCDILVKLPKKTRYDGFLDGFIATDIALVMDQKKGHCVSRLMATFPKGAKIDRYIKEDILPGCKELKLGRCEDVHRP